MQISHRKIDWMPLKKSEACPQRHEYIQQLVNILMPASTPTFKRVDAIGWGDICSLISWIWLLWHHSLVNSTPQYHQPRAAIFFSGFWVPGLRPNIYVCAIRPSWHPPPVPCRAMCDLYPYHLNLRTLVMKQHHMCRHIPPFHLHKETLLSAQ